jgi:phosphorylcholine metabolism protein LicD
MVFVEVWNGENQICVKEQIFFDVFKIDIMNVKHQHFDFSLSKLAFKSCLFKKFTSHATFVLGTLFGHIQNSFWGSITFHGVT